MDYQSAELNLINSANKTYSTFSSYLQRIKLDFFSNQGTSFSFQTSAETREGSHLLNFYKKTKAKEHNAKMTLKLSIQERDAAGHLSLFGTGPGLRAESLLMTWSGKGHHAGRKRGELPSPTL